MPLKVVTPPASEPVGLDQAKKHLRISADQLGGDGTADDDLIAELITAARELCEGWTARSFITTAWRLTQTHFPVYWLPGEPAIAGGPWTPTYLLERGYPGTLVPILIPRAELIAVTAINYVDTGGNVRTLDPSLYIVEAGAPPKIYPAYGRSWPSTRFQPNAVTIDFTVGYGDDATAVPGHVKAAMKLLLGNLYENREATTPVALEETPLAFRTLLAMADWGYRA